MFLFLFQQQTAMKLFSVSSLLSWRSYSYSLHQKIKAQLLHTSRTRTVSSRKGSISNSLYRRISPLGDPNSSVAGVLDRWVEEGNSTCKGELQRIIVELSNWKRFKHALEVSMWMTNKRDFPIASYDVGVRLKLINKVFGLEQAEHYFTKIPESLKDYKVYLAILNCYSIAKSVDKAESVMQKARDLGYAITPIWYNLLMDVHCKLGNTERLGELLTEMEGKGIPQDQFTYSICLSSCAAASDVARMDKVMAKMESAPRSSIHWKTYVIAANCYLRMELSGKVSVILNKLEAQLEGSKKMCSILSGVLLNLYAEAGKKEDVYRVWDLHEKHCKGLSKGYMNMMRSLMKFDDVKGAEKIFGEWESRGFIFDFRVADFLIDAYCENGRLEEAEALIAKGTSKGGVPKVSTWLYMARGYLEKDQVPKAIEVLKEAILVCPPNFASLKDLLTSCLGCLENGNHVGKAKELVAYILQQRKFLRDVLPDEISGLMKDADLESYWKIKAQMKHLYLQMDG